MLPLLTIALFFTPPRPLVKSPIELCPLIKADRPVSIIDTVPGKPTKPINDSKKHAFKDAIDWSNIARAKISKTDSTLSIRGDIKKDYRIIGYEKPSLRSKALIMFSVFTDDVENNPLNCPFFSYYSTSDMAFEDTDLKFVGFQGSFAKVQMISENKRLATIYFPKKWVEFSD